LIVGKVVWAKGASFAVFEPFLADLVATDVEVPDGFRYSNKAIPLFVEDDIAALTPNPSPRMGEGSQTVLFPFSPLGRRG
jgi:hypothetical protein